MDVASLVGEGQRLARPCVLLSEVGEGVPVGVWGGSGPVFEAVESQHRLTVDRHVLPSTIDDTASGTLSVYYALGEEGGDAIIDPSGSVASLGDGTPLYARRTLSLPPLDAVFRFGSPAVGVWLETMQWSREWEYNDNFPDRSTAEAYERGWQANCPLYTGGVHAMLGGWSMPWPDGDWEVRLSDTLLIWTFADAEPWLEVWQRSDELEVVARVT